MDEIIEGGVKIVSNQVQFSLIDLRPTFKMAESCSKHKVKLLTYGSLVRFTQLVYVQLDIDFNSVVDFWQKNGSANQLPTYSTGK
jgi:diketogulonate reductase-like aldo/keto reductase